MVWQPMMKMTCMGPNFLKPSCLRWRMAKPNLMINTLEKKQMLTVMQMLLALWSQTIGLKSIASTMYCEFSTTTAMRKPIATRAKTRETARTRCRYKGRVVVQIT